MDGQLWFRVPGGGSQKASLALEDVFPRRLPSWLTRMLAVGRGLTASPCGLLRKTTETSCQLAM